MFTFIEAARRVGQVQGGTNEVLGGDARERESDLDWIMIKCSLVCI